MNTQHSLFKYIVKEGSAQLYLSWGLGICILQFIVFKLFYPFPDFFSDSYSYLFAAYAHLDISIWPIGYSKFLGFFHSLTYSDTALTGFQYFFMQFSAIYFFFTILYFFNPSKWVKNSLFIFLFINPLSLYLCNTINSDALFGALSLLWFTELIWIIQRPRTYQIFTHAILLFLCFTVRNNAYYYPIISLFSWGISQQKITVKILGVLLPFLFIIPFVIHTRNEAYKLTGIRQFSLFTGWQLANNALYIYDQITVDSMLLPTLEARQLNRLALQFLKIQKKDYRESLESFEGNFFIKSQQAPLKQYFRTNYTSNTNSDIVRNWGKASAIFEPFGKSIILEHPIAYARYFMWPNTLHYFSPPLLHLGLYNYGEDNIDPIAKYWFHYPNTKIWCISHEFQSFLVIYEAFFLLINIWYALQITKYFMRSKFILLKELYHPTIWMSTLFLLCNFGFSVFATVNILRYQYIPMFVMVSFGCLLNDNLASHNADRVSNKTNSTLIKRQHLIPEN